MEETISAEQLRRNIVLLEAQQAEEGKVLKEQFFAAYESVKPINIIKSTIRDVSESQEIKDHLVNTAVGMAAGYATKKIVESLTDSKWGNLLGTVLMFGVTNSVTKNPEAMKAIGKTVINAVGITIIAAANKYKAN